MGNIRSKKVPLVIGVSILDITMAMAENMPTTLDGAMYHGISGQSAGGVGRNLAESIYKLYGNVNFISLIGQDILGDFLLKLMPEKLWQNIERNSKYRSSSCTVIIDNNGECQLILGDMDIHENFHPHFIKKRGRLLGMAPLVIIDGNLPTNTLSYILQETQRLKVPVFYEPTDLRIAGKPFLNISRYLTDQIRLISPNYAELEDIVDAACGTSKPSIERPHLKNVESLKKSVMEMLNAINHLFDCIVVTLGQFGIVLSLDSSIDPNLHSLFLNQKYVFDLESTTTVKQKCITFFPTPIVVEDVVNVSGAGDSFAGGFISGLLKEFTVAQAIALGFMAAREALQTTAAVPHEYFPRGGGTCDSNSNIKFEVLQKAGNVSEKVLS